jgi:hypothetical protein
VIAGIIGLLIGATLTHVGWRHWRYRKQQTISVLEAGLLKAANAEPLPRTKIDRFLTYLQAILGCILGPFFLLCGIAVIAGELGYL